MNRAYVGAVVLCGLLFGGYFLYQRTGPVPETPGNLAALDDLLRESIESELEQVRGLRRSRAAWLRLARMYEANALFPDAVRCYERILERWPDEARAAYHLGCSYERSGDLVRARESMEQAVALAPDYPGAWNRLASWCLDLGELERAIEAVERSRTLDADDQTLAFIEVRVALARRESGRALEIIEERELLSEPYGYHLLALASRMNGDLVAAEAAHAKGEGTRLSYGDPWTMEMMGLQRGYAAMRRVAGRLLKAGNPAKAIPLLEKVVAHDPEDVRSLNMLGVSHLQLKNYPRAIELFEATLVQDPLHHDASINFAKAVSASKTAQPKLLSNAGQRLRAALERRPDEAAGWRVLATLEENAGRQEKSFEALEQVVRIEPGATDARLKAAYLLVSLRRIDEALQRFRALSSETPGLAEAHLGELTALVLGGRKEEAGKLQAALENKGLDPVRLGKLRASIERLP